MSNLDEQIEQLRQDFTLWFEPLQVGFSGEIPETEKHKTQFRTMSWHEFNIWVLNYVAQAEKEARKPYDELIYAVSNKYPNETRHQTALRYIRSTEQGGEATAQLREENK